MTNPYYGFGRRIAGERLAGRSAEFRRFASYLSTFEGSLSVIGIGRIGKTSLVHAVVAQIMENARAVAQTSLTVAAIPTAALLYDAIVTGLAESCLQRQIVFPEGFQAILQAPAPDEVYPAFRRCRRVLQLLARAGIVSLVVFDEFDGVKDFLDAKLLLQGLRELIDFRDETGFVAAIISRRSLYHLERQVAGLSNLDGVCEKHFLTPLGEAGLREIFMRGAEIGFKEADFDLLASYTGGHPFLAEMILCRGWEQWSMQKGVEESRADLVCYNNHLREMLIEDNIFDQLLQATVGPVFKLSLEPIERLQRYGIMLPVGLPPSRGYRAWSENFQLFLEHSARETPLWSLWHETETELRWRIRETLCHQYGNDWLSVVVTRHPAVARMANGTEGHSEGCLVRMEREQKNFGSGASDDPLDYTYPLDLWAMISAEWSTFKEFFGRDKTYWGERFNLLAKVRTPTAHNREHSLPEHILTTAKGYCQELLATLHQKL